MGELDNPVIEDDNQDTVSVDQEETATESEKTDRQKKLQLNLKTQIRQKIIWLRR